MTVLPHYKDSRMEHIFRALALATLVFSLAATRACADEIPAEMARSLKQLALEGAPVLNGGVLVIRINRPTLNLSMLPDMMEQGPCWPMALKPHRKEYRSIGRFVFLNKSGGQGYALDGGEETCHKLGDAHSQQELLAWLRSHALVCLAGQPCRPRKPNEHLDSD